MYFNETEYNHITAKTYVILQFPSESHGQGSLVFHIPLIYLKKISLFNVKPPEKYFC